LKEVILKKIYPLFMAISYLLLSHCAPEPRHKKHFPKQDPFYKGMVYLLAAQQNYEKTLNLYKELKKQYAEVLELESQSQKDREQAILRNQKLEQLIKRLEVLLNSYNMHIHTQKEISKMKAPRVVDEGPESLEEQSLEGPPESLEEQSLEGPPESLEEQSLEESEASPAEEVALDSTGNPGIVDKASPLVEGSTDLEDSKTEEESAEEDQAIEEESVPSDDEETPSSREEDPEIKEFSKSTNTPITM